MEDVGDEAVFDASGVFLESENDAGETDTGEIEERHFEWGEGVFERDDDENKSENGGIGVFAEEEGGGAFEVIDGLAAFGDDIRDAGEIAI